MFTTDEVRAIPILSVIPAANLESLAQSAADIQLAPGEFAVNEGDERALYAVISGKMEVVKLFDGVPRTLGWRAPGAIFGEVPMALGTPFPGGLPRRRVVAGAALERPAISRGRGRRRRNSR